MIPLNFISRTPIVAANRVGIDQTINADKLDVLGPMQQRLNRVVKWSERGQRFRQTTKAAWWETQIRTPLILEPDLNNWMELIISCGEYGEAITVGTDTHPGINKEIVCMLPEDTLTPTRLFESVGYSLEFTLRIINDSWP